MKLMELLTESEAAGELSSTTSWAEIRKAVEAVVSENQQLKERVSKLEDKAARLRQQLAEIRAPGTFVECRGALLKRAAEGGYEPDAYCIECKVPMVSLSKVLPFQCPR